MENEAWLDYMLQPISLGAEDAEMPKMQLYKDVSELRIQPDEGTTNHENRNQFTFTNRNLDIIQNLHEAYIEYTCVFSSTSRATRNLTNDENTINEFFHKEVGGIGFATGTNGTEIQVSPGEATHLSSVDSNRIRFKRVQSNVYGAGDIPTDNDLDGLTASGETLEIQPFYTQGFYALCLPQTAFWIDGYTFELNDTTVSTQNSGVARSLNVLNHGVYAKESRQLSLYGMTNGDNIKSPFELQKYKLVNGDLRLKVPLKYIIPYLSTNKVSWGVKSALKLTKLNKTDIKNMFNHIPGTATDFDVDIKDIELVVPYVKLENNKQLSLWNQMYSSVNNRYWLENDHFTSQVYDNRISHLNEVYRIATKGLNSRPRWLLLSACDPDAVKTDNLVPNWRNAMTPMGFDDRTTRYMNGNPAINELKFTKIRVKINGIYIDGGDVLEFQNSAISATDYKTMGKMGYGGDYFLAYENYCKFFGSYHSKRGTPKDFEQWLESQVFCFDLVNIDSENIFANSGNALIIEVEFSTAAGSHSNQTTQNNFKLVANVLYDKQLSISHANNSAILTIT